MKKAFYLISWLPLFFVSFACSSQANETKKNNQNMEKKQIIGLELSSVKEFEQQYKMNVSFDIVQTIYDDFNNDGIADTIRLSRIRDWDDPGDFHLIEININELKKEIFFNGEGWIAPESIGKVKTQGVNKELIENFLKFDFREKGKVLVFYGYPYGSTAWLTTIFSFTNKGVQLIHNEYQILNKVINESENIEFTFRKEATSNTDNELSNTYKFKRGWFYLIGND